MTSFDANGCNVKPTLGCGIISEIKGGQILVAWTPVQKPTWHDVTSLGLIQGDAFRTGTFVVRVPTPDELAGDHGRITNFNSMSEEFMVHWGDEGQSWVSPWSLVKVSLPHGSPLGVGDEVVRAMASAPRDPRPARDESHASGCAKRGHEMSECTCGKADREMEEDDKAAPAEPAPTGPNRYPLNDQELGTILAALRTHQNVNLGPGGMSPDLYDIATNDGSFALMNRGEVDELCERLNFMGAMLD